MALRYLGKGTTDEHGVAHLTEDASGSTVNPPGYVGQGIGELDVVASVDKPIASGSVVSQPYPVIDAIAKDVDNSLSLDYYFFARANVSETNNQKVMVRTDTGACYITPTSDTSKNFNKRLVFDVPFRVEFDITQVDSSFHTIMQTETEGTGSFWSLDLTETGHYTIDMLENSQVMKKGNTTVSTGSYPIVKASFLLYNGSNSTGAVNEVMSFKNLVIYPI